MIQKSLHLLFIYGQTHDSLYNKYYLNTSPSVHPLMFDVTINPVKILDLLMNHFTKHRYVICFQFRLHMSIDMYVVFQIDSFTVLLSLQTNQSRHFFIKMAKPSIDVSVISLFGASVILRRRRSLTANAINHTLSIPSTKF